MIRRHLGSNDDLFTLQEKKFLKQIENWGLTPEEQSIRLTEYYIKQTELLLTSSSEITINLLEMEYKTELLYQQALQVVRQIQGYDDNLMVKMGEFQSGLASFAVNSGSDSAQAAIDDLKAILEAIEKRVKLIVNNDNPVVSANN
jgi:hypothetical protein